MASPHPLPDEIVGKALEAFITYLSRCQMLLRQGSLAEHAGNQINRVLQGADIYFVVNQEANRLVGDEQYDADFEWGMDRGVELGRPMKSFPDWFLRDEPRPSRGRKTFNLWYYYRRDSRLQPAGLVGPVSLMFLDTL